MSTSLLARIFMVGSALLLLLLVGTCVASPTLWMLGAESPLRVQVLDKTVPHVDYREHAALFWVLRHDKVLNPGGNRDWSLDANYVGFEPDPEDTRNHGTGRDLQESDLIGADVLFLADAYGVYTGDFEQSGQRAALDRSTLLYGGLDDAEVDLIEPFVADGHHLIAEFNTIASPTTGSARSRLEALLGVHWTGWSGRYFPDLGDAGELPHWAPRDWREQNRQEWEFEGPGYLLVHESSRLFVLQTGVEAFEAGLTIRPLTGEPLVQGTLDRVRFNYWFDIVEPATGSTVIASYDLAVTAAGADRLREFGVPASFPAVVVASEEPLRVYLAGDFSDAGGSLGPHWLAGLPALNKTLIGVWFPSGADQEPFYWGLYIPLMRNLLAMAAR